MNDLHVLPVLYVTLDEPTHLHAERHQPGRACTHAQPRSTLDHHQQRLAAALITELLEADTWHIDMDLGTCASGAGLQSNHRDIRAVFRLDIERTYAAQERLDQACGRCGAEYSYAIAARTSDTATTANWIGTVSVRLNDPANCGWRNSEASSSRFRGSKHGLACA
jgi:hypothetical protein